MKSLAAIKRIMVHSGNLAIDIGCGTMAHQAFEMVYGGTSFDRVIGLDCFHAAIEERMAAYSEHGSWEFALADAALYAFPGRCSLITALHSLEHLTREDAKDVLSRAIASAGQVIVETPNEFEDGEKEAGMSGNAWQRHACLLEPGFFRELGMARVFTYQQNRMFSNSVYAWRSDA